MPVTVPHTYRQYAVLHSTQVLDLRGTRCIHEACRVAHPATPLRPTAACVQRPVLLLEEDDHGELTIVREEGVVMLAQCDHCGARVRVLPCNILPFKRYSLEVIETMVLSHGSGKRSLRTVVTEVLGERTPAHTSLHGWTEGIGAYALGQPAGALPEAQPASRLLEVTEEHAPEAVASHQKASAIPPIRYRSEPRHARLAAAYIFLACALVLASRARAPWGLVQWHRGFLTWVQGTPWPLGFRAVLARTRVELVGSKLLGHSDRGEPEVQERWPTRTRSPPSSSRP